MNVIYGTINEIAKNFSESTRFIFCQVSKNRLAFSTNKEKIFLSGLRQKNLNVMVEEGNRVTKKLNLKSLLKNKRQVQFELIPQPTEKKAKGKVDLKLMKEELKQLEDPPLTPWEKKISSKRLPFTFFNAPSRTLAKSILGKVLVRQLDNGVILKGRIIETESYLGVEDKASHTYEGKITPRNAPMYMPPGTIYVYFTYGMYHCFNISSQEEGSAVLIRALEPLEGIEQMKEHRSLKPNAKKISKELKPHELCNGPSKICMALKLEKSHSKFSLCSWKGLWIEDDGFQEKIKIVECPRIGIESAGEEWAKKPLRYYIYGHKCVSKRDKKAESNFSTE